ncbi:MAG: putative Ig domain-containing protein [Acidobacteriota bacterium]|nr:putative Ig domain-containing protein [Acidobacteriota bacterium]
MSLVWGCGGSSSKITIGLASSTGSSTVDAGASAITITATVSNDSKNAGVTFSLSPSSGCGTLVSSSTTAAAYTPPSASTLTASCTATITATSVSQTGSAAEFAFTVNPIAVALTNSASSTTLGAGAAAVTLTATLSNEASTSDTVTWSMSSTMGSSAITRRPAIVASTCGSISATSSSSGTGITYTPPLATALTSACTATITASSTINTNITKSVTFTVNPLTITLTPPAVTAVLEGSTSGTISAALTSNGTSDSTLNWSLSPSNCGTLSAATGTSVTFTPTAPIPSACTGGATVTVAADAAPQISKSVAFSITQITASLSPTSATLYEGATQVFTPTTTDPSGVSWSVANTTCGALTSTSTTSATYTAPTTISAACTNTVTATSKTDGTVSAAAGITANPLSVSITSPSSPAAATSGATATTITATTTDPAGASTLTWALNPSSGCGALSASSGASLSYTPPTMLAASCSAVATATSKTDTSKSASVTFNVTPAPIALTLVTPSPNSGNAANSTLSYASTLAVTATLYNDANSQGIGSVLTSGCGTFSGMALASTSGATTIYSGTYTAPSSTCTGTLTLTANAATSQTATVNLTVQPGISVTLSPNTAQSLDTGQTLSITPTVNYDTAGKGVNLSLSPASGCGTLSASTANSGTAFTYTAPTSLSASCSATITAASQSDGTKTATLAVTAYPAPVLQSTTSLGTVYTGESYNGAINVSGGLAPYTWTVTGGGDGISAGSSTSSSVAITSSNVTSTTATSSAPDTITFNASVKDANNVTVSGTFTLSVYAYTAVSLPSATLSNATNGATYSAAINASGGAQTYHFTVNGTTIPVDGTATTIDSAYGLTGTNSGGNTLSIGGTPSVTTTPTTITLNVSLTDGESSTASGTYTITVKAASTLVYTAANLTQAQGMAGMPYSAGIDWQGDSSSVISGGATPYTLAITGLPSGLSADSAGNITGTPSAAANTTVTIVVTDSSSTPQSLTKTFVIPVVAATTATYNSRISGQYACEIHEAIDGGYAGGMGSTLYMKARAFAFAADGSGNITGGEADTNGPSGYKFSSSVTGTYVVGADDRGTMTVSSNIFALAGGALDSYGQFAQFRFIDMDDAGSAPTGKHGGGICYRQYNSDGTAVTSSSNTLSSTTVANRWVFAFNGESGGGNVETQVGMLNLSSLTGAADSVSGTSVDSDQALTVTGTTALDSWGRMTITAGPSGGTGTTAIYITNQTYGKAVGITTTSHMSTSNADMFWGQLRVQNHSDISASYPITGNFVLYLSGMDTSNSTYKALIAQGAGGTAADTITVNAQVKNNGGTVGFNGTPVGSGALSYTTDASTGRTTLNAVSGIVFYLFDTNEAVALFADSENMMGWLEPQTTPSGGTWSTAYLGSSTGVRVYMGEMYNGDPGAGSSTGVLTLGNSTSTASIASMAQDYGGENYADWDEGIGGSYGVTATAALSTDTTVDSGAAYGFFDAIATPGSTTNTEVYCLVATPSSAYSSSYKGRILCVDGGSGHSPRVSIMQE